MKTLQYLSGECHDAIVEHFFRYCPVALCHEDAEVFFGILCLIIDEEIGRVVGEIRKPPAGDSACLGPRNGPSTAWPKAAGSKKRRNSGRNEKRQG